MYLFYSRLISQCKHKEMLAVKLEKYKLKIKQDKVKYK